MLSYTELKESPKVLLAFTGLTQTEFEALLPSFANVWRQYRQQRQAQAKRQRAPGGGRKTVLKLMKIDSCSSFSISRPIHCKKCKPISLE